MGIPYLIIWLTYLIIFICIIMVNKLIDGVGYLKSKFQTDQLDEKLKEAVSEENWQASSQLLHQIANQAYNYQKEQKILTFLWGKLKDKSWKKVLKTLHLVDFLLKYGPTSTIEALKENIYQFRSLDNYSCYADGADRGQAVRKQSKLIVDLISDDNRLSDERAKAKQIKERMAQVLGSGAHYGSYSSNTSPLPENKSNQKGYEAYNNNYFSFKKNDNEGNLSFGQSVVRGLQNSKKEPEVKGFSKVVTTNNNVVQKKTQSEIKKTPFNSLNMKLVKPPAKKINEQKIQQKPNKPQQQYDQINANKPQKPIQNNNTRPQGKTNNEINIMDLDLLSFDSSPKQQPNQNQNNNFSYDILSSQKTSNANTNQNGFDFNLMSNPFQNKTQNVKNTHQITSNFMANSPNTQPINQYTPNITSLYSPPQQSNSFYQPSIPQQPSLQQQNYFNLNTNPQPNKTNNNIIKLEYKQEQQPGQSNPSSLIDFSDFRNELNSISTTDNKKSITESWNW